ncbi:MAG: delta subunit of GMP phosphodiesterase [Olpidium bornovanus]|uniref:Delta subunit of GMP phosphodiesterase n=1 Tax=Olpidium bornovanus TaxID=278681 RepID=A0A8H7ZZB8_9FUNG|nr:MAG: delta subunit of GMP phosphodiesterase [Olpidium bornovanus]
MTNIQFLEFRILETESNKMLFNIKCRDTDAPVSSTERLTTSDCDPTPGHHFAAVVEKADDLDVAQDDGRTVHYDFGAEFLTYKSIGTKLVFAVGDKEVKNFRMIERHYFKNKLLKSYDFSFGFCVSFFFSFFFFLPSFNSQQRQHLGKHLHPEEMIEAPRKTVSDSFYFIDDKLVMHSKATYTFSRKN